MGEPEGWVPSQVLQDADKPQESAGHRAVQWERWYPAVMEWRPVLRAARLQIDACSTCCMLDTRIKHDYTLSPAELHTIAAAAAAATAEDPEPNGLPEPEEGSGLPGQNQDPGREPGN